MRILTLGMMAVTISWLHSGAAAAGDTIEQIDDALEQIDDTTSEPLPDDMEPLKQRKFPPLRLKANEEIEWGDFGTDVTTFRTGVSAEMPFPISKNFVGALSSQFGFMATEFSGSKGFLNTGQRSGDPWDDLYDFSLGLRTQYSITETWGLVFGGGMTSRWENGASFGDGLKGTGEVGVSYRLGDRFSMAAGVSAGSRIVGNGVSVDPFATLAYKINDRHTLKSHGLGLLLRSKWNKKFTTFAYGSMQSERWRLADRNDGFVDQGSLRDRRLPIGLGVEWKFCDGWRLRTDLAIVVYRQLKVTDDGDHKFDTETASAPGVFGSLQLQYRF